MYSSHKASVDVSCIQIPFCSGIYHRKQPGLSTCYDKYCLEEKLVVLFTTILHDECFDMSFFLSI